MVNLPQFVKDHTPLCVCTCGLAILGYFGYHAVRWTFNKCAKTDRINHVAQRTITSQVTYIHVPIEIKVQANEVSLGQESERKKTLAAVKIQSCWRGHSRRVKTNKEIKHLLSHALLEKAKPYIDNQNLNLPRATSGIAPVYLPHELPIVLKQSGSPENQLRFDQMKLGREICEKSGYENLIIPKARVYKNFIIESRLPITEHGTKEQIGLYIENCDRFTNAVKEFIGFLCQSELTDITSRSVPYSKLTKMPVGRYDNIALYLEENRGKIGLIDLERFTPGCDKSKKDWCILKCRDAIHLFPYHFNQIMDIAIKFDPDIERSRKDLEKERDEVLKFFKLAYEDHFDFIKEKRISLENPSELVEINSVRIDSIKAAIVSLIKKTNTYCLGEKPEETMALFEKSFPIILDLTATFISENLKNKIKPTKEAISSYRQLLSHRTLRFSIHDKSYKDLQIKVASELKMMSFREDWLRKNYALIVIQGIFEELANGREIAYYNPRFEYDVNAGDIGIYHATHCIFC